MKASSDTRLNYNLSKYIVEKDQAYKAAVHDALSQIKPTTQPTPKIRQATYSSIRDSLSQYNISMLWNEAHFDRSRQLFRPSFNEKIGPGATNVMPALAAYLTTPGRNKAFFRKGTDTTLLAYFQEQGFLGDYDLIDDIDDLCEKSRQDGKKVYTIDDYGVHNDDIVVNETALMKVGNSKEFVQYLTDFPPAESIVELDDVTEEHYFKHCDDENTVFIKTCNTETAGSGVYVARSLEEFNDHLSTIKNSALELNGSSVVVVQSKSPGTNYSFQMMANNGDLEMMSISEQLIAKDGKSFAGNIHRAMTPTLLENVTPVASSLYDRLQAIDPNVFGIIMCDYIETESKEKVAIDPGLRPSGNTAATMISLLLKESGKDAFIKNAVSFKMGRPTDYSEIADRLGDLADIKKIIETRKGALPWGFNQLDGKGLFIIIAPSESEFCTVKQEIDNRLSEDLTTIKKVA